VDVSIDVTRENEFTDAIDLFPERRRVLFADRDALDLAAVDDHRRIRQNFAVSGIDHGSTDKRYPLRAKGRRKE
jgi:hypothetical protein